MKRAVAVVFSSLALSALALHAGLAEIARATGGVAALLAPSPAASVVGLLTAALLLGVRVFLFVVLPALTAAFLVFLVTSKPWTKRARADGPGQKGA